MNTEYIEHIENIECKVCDLLNKGDLLKKLSFFNK